MRRLSENWAYYNLTVMKLIAFCFLLVIAPSVGLACSCIFGSGCWSPSGEGVEFVGTPTAVHSTRDGVAVDFTVSEAFGRSNSKFHVENFTPQGPTTLSVYEHFDNCGYSFRLGVEYFVSANSFESKLWTSICSQTRPAIAAAALIRQARAIRDGKPPARLFGFVGVEPDPGVSPLSRLEAKPTASVVVIAVGRTGEFRTTTAADGSFEFTRLPESTYHLRLELPKDVFIWRASDKLKREYAVSPGKICEADFSLYLKDDPFAVNQPR